MAQRIAQSASAASGGTSSGILRKKDNLSDLEILKKLLDHYAPSKKIALSLRILKIKISVSVFLLACLVISIVTFLTLKISLHTLPALFLAIALGSLPLFYLKLHFKRYLQRFSEYLPSALSIISSAIKVGHGLDMAIQTVAKTAPYPVDEEFQTVIGEMKFGLTLPDAMNNLYDRIKSEELKIFVTGISIHQELGGNLSEILDNLEKTIRDRFALMREINTLSAQGKFSSWVLFAIPFALAGLYRWKSSELFLDYVHSGFGQLTLMICVVLQTIGFIGIRMVVNLKD